MGHRVSDADALKLERYGIELFRLHIRSRVIVRASGEVQFILRFERGMLRQIETVDKTKVIAEMLPDNVKQNSATASAK